MAREEEPALVAVQEEMSVLVDNVVESVLRGSCPPSEAPPVVESGVFSVCSSAMLRVDPPQLDNPSAEASDDTWATQPIATFLADGRTPCLKKEARVEENAVGLLVMSLSGAGSDF